MGRWAAGNPDPSGDDKAAGGHRLPALDAARGVLALLVALHHLVESQHGEWLSYPAHLAVLAFFTMSGYVLERSYDGRVLTFAARRLVRLWPVYALCIAAGHAMAGTAMSPGELVWWPLVPFPGYPPADPPAWSLYYEVWAIPAFPLMFAAVRAGWVGAVGIIILAAALVMFDLRFQFGICFAVGVAATRLRLRLPARVPAPLLWLGKVSYSLYLSHVLVMFAMVRLGGSAAAFPALPLELAVAWAIWWAVERPSILLSRRAGAVLGGLLRARDGGGAVAMLQEKERSPS